jgi:RecJ-like exonuclease
MVQTLRKLDRKFSVKIVKSLDKEFICSLPKNKLILFLDLASGVLSYIEENSMRDVFIIDHHEVIREIPEGVEMINPELHEKQKISGAGMVYLFSKEINESNKEFAKLAILGMIGDMLEKEIGILNHGILDDGEIKKRRGLLIYPSTRPLNKVLEFCSNPYIPEVTGNVKGVLELLREIGINSKNGKYPSLMELNEEEMEKLVTAIMLRNPKAKNYDIVGDIFLIKFFNKLEDARELSAMINACSRLGESETAIKFCLESLSAKKKVESIHAKYKQFIVSGLRFAEESGKIEGNGYVILNAKDKIKDSVISVIATILATSGIYEEGTVIIALADEEGKERIKVSARIVGRSGRNVREILSNIIQEVGGEVGGHEYAAGCIIEKKDEKKFIDLLKKNIEIEMVKI